MQLFFQMLKQSWNMVQFELSFFMFTNNSCKKTSLEEKADQQISCLAGACRTVDYVECPTGIVLVNW